jgi:hypothetical protein
MTEILYKYEMNATTWVYLSSLIMITVYFRFRRFWSVRNVDLIALLLFAPGLLLISHGVDMRAQSPGLAAQGAKLIAQGQEMLAHWPAPQAQEMIQQGRKMLDFAQDFQQRGPLLKLWGFLWVFMVGLFFLVRLLVDPLMVRRPMLEPNLSAGGLTFAGAAMLVFLFANVVTPGPTESDLKGGRWMDKLLAREDSPEIEKYLAEHGPGYPLFFIFSSFSDKPAPADAPPEERQRAWPRVAATRTTAILAHLAVVLGMILIGYRHFDNIQTGVAASTLYLLLPYTANYTPDLYHVVPAALLVWAVQSYRRPMVAGMLMGLAAGVVYYALYLLPLWCSFYWRRGLLRFCAGAGIVLLLLAGLLVFTSSDLTSYLSRLRQMFGLRWAEPVDLSGFWTDHAAAFRYPVIVAFAVMCAGMALWPAQKNLGTLLSCSAAIMLGAQFWKAQDGGIYMAWYLPLLILTIFRPNLEDRIALGAVSEGWLRRRKAKT